MRNWFDARLRAASKFRVPDRTPTLSLIGTKFIATNDGDAGDLDGWYGRPSMVVRRNSAGKLITIMTYKEGQSHAHERYGIIHQRMSDDFGTTWSNEDKDLVGNPIIGMPTRPANAGSPYGNDKGPSHGILTLCPNGDILCHMWASDYSGTDNTANNDGGHQARSTDGGLTWGPASRQTILGGYPGRANTTFFGEGRTVVDGTIWMIIRDVQAQLTPYKEEQHLAKSEDNGITWYWVSKITTLTVPNGVGTSEASLEYLGEGRFLCLLRPGGIPGAGYSEGYMTHSLDWGATWSTPIEITDAMNIPAGYLLGRTIIKTRAHLKLQSEWWKDRVIFVFGFTSLNGVSAGSRRNTGWVGVIPEDYDLNNITWGPIFYPDVAGYDGGYGDFFWNPILKQIVFCSYRAPTSLYDASVKQYNIEFAWE